MKIFFEDFLQEQLLDLHKIGFLPLEEETAVSFQRRVEKVKQFSQNPFSFFSCGEEPFPLTDKIPWHHWDWTQKTLEKIFDFSPAIKLAYFSNQGLFFWQGAQAWLFPEKGISMIQLRKKFKKGNYTIYSKEEVLAHEAVHSFRSGLKDSFFEEIFAYAVSSNAFRRIFGPLLQTPREVGVFLLPLGVLWASLFIPGLTLAAWVFFGAVGGFFLFRLAYYRKIFQKAFQKLQVFCPKINPWFILVRLEGEEIKDLAYLSEEEFPAYRQKKVKFSLRWQMIEKAYFSKKR